MVPMTVRTLLQKLGTEAVRDQVHTNAWVNALFADYKPTGEFNTIHDATIYPNWVISDTRFVNEAKAIKDRSGIVVRITRDVPSSYPSNYSKLHASEIALNDWEFDYELPNIGSLEELLEQVRTMLLHFKIIT